MRRSLPSVLDSLQLSTYANRKGYGIGTDDNVRFFNIFGQTISINIFQMLGLYW